MDGVGGEASRRGRGGGTEGRVKGGKSMAAKHSRRAAMASAGVPAAGMEGAAAITGTDLNRTCPSPSVQACT